MKSTEARRGCCKERNAAVSQSRKPTPSKKTKRIDIVFQGSSEAKIRPKPMPKRAAAHNPKTKLMYLRTVLTSFCLATVVALNRILALNLGFFTV